MKPTPKHIIEAVKRFTDDRNPTYLLEMFDNGAPFHEYAETKDLVHKLLTGSWKFKDGRGLKSKVPKEIRPQIAAHIAQLSADSGYVITAKGEKVNKTRIDEYLANVYATTPAAIYEVYKEYKNTDFYKQHTALAKKYLVR